MAFRFLVLTKGCNSNPRRVSVSIWYHSLMDVFESPTSFAIFVKFRIAPLEIAATSRKREKAGRFLTAPSLCISSYRYVFI